jgi:hypothetical protein
VLQLNASTMPMSTTIQEVIDRFNANLAKQMKDDYGIEVKKIKIFHIGNRILLVLIWFPILLVGAVLNL